MKAIIYFETTETSTPKSSGTNIGNRASRTNRSNETKVTKVSLSRIKKLYIFGVRIAEWRINKD